MNGRMLQGTGKCGVWMVDDLCLLVFMPVPSLYNPPKRIFLFTCVYVRVHICTYVRDMTPTRPRESYCVVHAAAARANLGARTYCIQCCKVGSCSRFCKSIQFSVVSEDKQSPVDYFEVLIRSRLNYFPQPAPPSSPYCST